MERENSQGHDQESHTITYLEEYKIEKVIRGLSAALREPLVLYFVHGSTVPEIADILNAMVTTIDLEIKMGIWIIQKRLGIDEIDKEMKAKIANVWSKIIEQEQEKERAESPSEEELRMMDERASPISSPSENNVIRGIWDESPIEEPSVIDSKKRNVNASNKLWGNTARRLVTSIVIVSCLTASVVTGYAMYKTKFIQKIFGDYTEISLDQESGNQNISKNKIEEVYLPTYMVDGYELADSETDEDFANAIYKNDDYKELYLKQRSNSVANNTMNDDSIQESVLVNGEEAISIKLYGTLILLWYHDGYAFQLITDDGNLEIDDLIQMAESMKKQE